MIALQAYNIVWACGRQLLDKAKANLAQVVPPKVCKGKRLTARGSYIGI